MFAACRKSLCSRIPSIRFRYGYAPLRKSTATTPSPVTAATSPSPQTTSPSSQQATQQSQQILASIGQLPAHLRPRLISEEEMEAVRLGGATSYATAAKKKK